MPARHWTNAVKLAPLLLLSSIALTAELPDSFPGDIPVADFMEVTSSMQVRDDLMVEFHAPGQTMDGVADWLVAALTASGWDHTDDSSSGLSRILVFMKGGRRCGVMITDFIMSPSMQRIDTTKGVQMQISGGSDPGQGASSESADAATATEPR